MLSTHTPHKPKRTKGNFKTLDSNKSEATTSHMGFQSCYKGQKRRTLMTLVVLRLGKRWKLVVSEHAKKAVALIIGTPLLST